MQNHVHHMSLAPEMPNRQAVPIPDLPQRRESSIYTWPSLYGAKKQRHQSSNTMQADAIGCTDTDTDANTNTDAVAPAERKQSKGIHAARAPLQLAPRFSDKRDYIIYELVMTEDKYVFDLKILIAVFVVPLCEFTMSQPSQMEPIAHSLQVLFSFQHQFSRSLHRATCIMDIARLFRSESSGFESYGEYCSKYRQLCDILDHLELNSAWSPFLAKVHAQISRHSGKRRMGLRDFLIKPVQRICKYPLFLKDLLRHTKEDEEPLVYAELAHALALIKGVCEAIDGDQQRSDALKLRDILLSSYCDNSELPLSLISKLGSVALSGPLRIISNVSKGAQHSKAFGCMLFKRFLIVLKPKKDTTFAPQFWFPLHTMRLLDEQQHGAPRRVGGSGDDSNDSTYAWRLQHIKSGQYMVFYARSAPEKHMWVDKLQSAITNAAARMEERRCKISGALHPAMSTAAGSAQSTSAGQQPQSSARIEGKGILPVAGSSLPASVEPATVAGATTSRPFWQHSLSTAKDEQVERQFEKLTSPEILRLNTLSRLRKTQAPPPLPPPTNPASDTQLDMSPLDELPATGLPSTQDADGKHCAADASAASGAVANAWPPDGQQPDGSRQGAGNAKRNGTYRPHKSRSSPGGPAARSSMSARLLNLFDYFSINKPKPAAVSTTIAQGDGTGNHTRKRHTIAVRTRKTSSRGSAAHLSSFEGISGHKKAAVRCYHSASVVHNLKASVTAGSNLAARSSLSLSTESSASEPSPAMTVSDCQLAKP